MNRKRVVLLARAGAACERTQASIAEAGAELVATLDPSSATESAIRAAMPDAVMVILDPVVEQALEKFDGVLGDPAFDVMFEDADIAAKREGWDAARWARHLNAKLHKHNDVLPPAKGEPSAEQSLQNEPIQGVGFQQEMQDLQDRVAALPDIPQGNQDASPFTPGAVVIAAGVGGPDAVRQLLGMFPAGFKRPIVLRQRIEGGHYDKLLRQMQRATSLRVELAQAGDALQLGTVHILPDDFDLEATATGLVIA
ncbi:MAG: hypothetical protein M3Q51_07505, partial [Pseudomonadota bacterium]|nr:hypothetical protein [Pseudomonadota bacterium]